uniref:Uncharacterized protein LOC117349580 n=1 Tax=Geotrypetes seraphini TaxID=260995 RepID=A0A6P8NRZ3_GEOSA|nr:uncharacterized protein LOC117349580 [Geotrypetes seraphini]
MGAWLSGSRMPGPGRNEVVPLPLRLALFISAVHLYDSTKSFCELKIINRKSNLSVPLRSTLLLNCTIELCPDSANLTVTWGRMQLGQLMPINVSQIEGYDRKKEDKLMVVPLIIHKLMPEDEGQYLCKVEQRELTSVGHIISVHLKNASETNTSQAGIDNPQLGPETQPSNPLYIVAGVVGVGLLLLLLLGSSLWKFCLKDFLRARNSARLKILQSEIHYQEVKKEEEVTYTTVTISERPADALVRSSDTQGSSEYAILRFEPPPSLSVSRTTTVNSSHYFSV